jgi:hypothetical protein
MTARTTSLQQMHEDGKRTYLNTLMVGQIGWLLKVY